MVRGPGYCFVRNVENLEVTQVTRAWTEMCHGIPVRIWRAQYLGPEPVFYPSIGQWETRRADPPVQPATVWYVSCAGARDSALTIARARVLANRMAIHVWKQHWRVS